MEGTGEKARERRRGRGGDMNEGTGIGEGGWWRNSEGGWIGKDKSRMWG